MDPHLNSPEARQTILRTRVASGVPMALTALSEEFGVSVDTVRRDLQALADEGLVTRVRGGALPVMAPAAPVLKRIGTPEPTAKRIAAAALPMVEDGMVIMLDGGTTVGRLARLLPALPRALVVTPSPAVALETLAKGIATVQIGGRLSPLGGIAVGQAATAAIGAIAADIAFLGACGLEAGFGLGADDIEEAAVRQAICATSSRAVVLTGQAKLGRRARHRVLPCGELDLLITDAAAEDTRDLVEAGLEVRHA